MALIEGTIRNKALITQITKACISKSVLGALWLFKWVSFELIKLSSAEKRNPLIGPMSQLFAAPIHPKTTRVFIKGAIWGRLILVKISVLIQVYY